MATCKPEQAYLAYFYFDFRDEEKQNARNLVTSHIVMDALDECPDDSGWPKNPRKEVLDAVQDLVSLLLPNLCVCVTSRLEADIKSVLNQLTIHAVSLHDEREQKEGIANYISTIVNSDRKMRGWPDEDKELVIKELSERADGM